MLSIASNISVPSAVSVMSSICAISFWNLYVFFKFLTEPFTSNGFFANCSTLICISFHLSFFLCPPITSRHDMYQGTKPLLAMKLQSLLHECSWLLYSPLGLLTE